MRYTNQLLDALRREADPRPDALVIALAGRGEIAAVNAMLRRLERNDQPVPGELPDDLEGWLIESGRLPEGVDRARIERAAELFLEHGLQMSLILSTASLIACYAATKGVKALAFTHRMRRDLYHRAAETSQFVLLVLAPGGLVEGGGGIRAIQKVRLLHASMRHLIRRSGWPEDELGVPLCQEDMLLAMLTFSYDVTIGLRTLGVELAEDDAEDLLYTWGVIGMLLGIHAELIPSSMAEAAQLRALIARRQFGPSPEGVSLTAALIDLHDRQLPGEAFDGFLTAIIRLLVGKQVADWMEVPRSRWDHIVRHYRLLGTYLELIDRTTGSIGDLVDELAYRSLTRMSIEATGYERAGFEIPAELGEAWARRRGSPPQSSTACSASAVSRGMSQAAPEFAETEVLEPEEATLDPEEYRFVNTWRLRADLDAVADIIDEPMSYQHWWPCAWLDYEGITHGDKAGVGGIFRYKVKGWMPYTLNLKFTVTDVRAPYGYTVESTGDLVGKGTWTLRQDGPFVELRYEWRVRAERAFIRRLSGVLKPLFRSNHFWVMRNGARSLQLELARRRASTPEELARIPAPRGPTFPHNLRRRRMRTP